MTKPDNEKEALRDTLAKIAALAIASKLGLPIGSTNYASFTRIARMACDALKVAK